MLLRVPMILPYMPFAFKRFSVCGASMWIKFGKSMFHAWKYGKLYVICSCIEKPYFFMYVPDEKQNKTKILLIQKHFSILHPIKSTLFKFSANKPKSTNQHSNKQNKSINSFFVWQSVNRSINLWVTLQHMSGTTSILYNCIH